MVTGLDIILHYWWYGVPRSTSMLVVLRSLYSIRGGIIRGEGEPVISGSSPLCSSEPGLTGLCI